MKTLFLRILALIVILQPCQALKASWSPPVTIPLSNVSGGSGETYFDNAENLISLYQDATANNVLTVVRVLPTGIAAPSVVLSPVLNPDEAINLAVSSSGDHLVAVWTNTITNQIQASVYTTATTTWSAFQNVGPISTSVASEMLVISIDSSNRATVGWIDDTSGTPVVYSSTLSPLTGTWATPVSFTLSPITDVNPDKFLINASGHFVAASWTHEVMTDLFYHFIQIDQSVGVPAWSTIDDINIGTILVGNSLLREDSSGNIVLVWNDSGTVYSWNSNVIGSFITLASLPSIQRFFLEVDQAGKASVLIVTPLAPSMAAQTLSRILFFSTGNWSPVAALNTPSIQTGPDVTSLSVDAIGLGHSNYTWGQAPSPTIAIVNFATLTNPSNDSLPGMWSVPITLSNLSELSLGSSIAENAAGDLLVAWRVLVDPMTINATVSKKLANSTWSTPVVAVPSGDDILVPVLSNLGKGGIETINETLGFLYTVEISDTPAPPTPPTNLVGIVQKNVFLTQTDRIHVISWTPSTDITVIAYQVYRNGVLIATVPAIGPFVYADHNRNKKVPDTYSVVAISITGGVSTPISIVLQ